MSRQIALKLTHQAQEPIGLPALVRTLDALQKVLLQIGAMHAERDAQPQAARPSAGRLNNAIHAACDLRVVALKTGSAEAVFELPPPEPTLFPEDHDLGMQALATTRDLTAELANRASWQRVHELLPLEAHRDLILDSYRRFCPTRAEAAEVNLWDPDEPEHVYQLRSEARARVQLIRAQAAPDDVLEERQLLGRINMLQADPPLYTLLLPGGGSFRVPFDPELAEEYRPLWDECVIVNTICRVIRHADEDDVIVEVRDVVEITPVDESPLELAAIPLAAAPIALLEPLSVPPDFSDNLVNFNYDPLGIVAYGQTREEAEQAFREELAWLWQEYAAAPEDTLTAGAIRFKQHLHQLVGGVTA